MQRRTLIKQLAFAAGAFMLVPACVQYGSKASILLKKINIDGDQEKMLAELAETIIPKTDTPGAKDISAHLFAMKMVDDCYDKAGQERFMNGLKAFEDLANKQTGKHFVDCSTAERASVLAQLDKAKSEDQPINYFYRRFKGLTIQAYTNSKFYLTNIQVYKLVPGHYSGCVPVKKAS